MLRIWMVAVALVAGVTVSDASAQSPPPSAEVGAAVSATLVPGDRGLQWGPRLVLNIDSRNSMQFTASLQKLSPWGDAQTKRDLYLAAYRRLVHTAGPVRTSATIGGGFERTLIVVPATTFGNPPVTFPSSRGVELRPAFTTGAAIDVRLGSRAAVVLEPSFVLTEHLGGRFSAGLVVPLGSYPSGVRRLAPPTPWAGLDPGDRAWITTADGREVDAKVVGRSATTLSLRTPTGIVSFTADDVRAIDKTDPIRNGTVLGALIGGLGALVPSLVITGLVCTLEDGCDTGDVVYINSALLGMGAGIGAAVGALADSLRERRVPLYRRGGSSGFALTPIVGGHRFGAGAVIRW